jgi:hypothetical protein
MDHPLTQLVASLSLLRQQLGGLKHYIKTMSEFLMDTLSRLRGILDLSAINTFDGFLDYQDSSSTADLQRVMAWYEHLRSEATSEYGIYHRFPLQIEEQVLRFQWRHNFYQDDFVERSDELLRRLVGSAGSPNSVEAQDGVGSAVYQRYYRRMMDFWEYRGDLSTAIDYGRRALVFSMDGHYVQQSICIEYLLRKSSRFAEAEELKQRRLEYRWMEMVRHQTYR